MKKLSDPPKPRSKAYIYFLSLGVAAGSFVMGFCLVATGLLEEHIQSYNNIPKDHMDFYLSIIITLLPFGAIVGSMVNQKLTSAFGQKMALIYVDLLMVVAILLQEYSLSLYSMYVSRFLFGVFCGISSSIIPVYLTSLAPLDMVGAVGSLNQLLITIGISVAYAMQFFLSSNAFDSIESRIKIFIGIPLLFCTFRVFVLGYIFPQSFHIYYFRFDTVERLFASNRKKEIEQIVDIIYEDADISSFVKYKNLQKQTKFDEHLSKSTEPSNKKCSRVIALSVVLAIANQMSGVNAIFFYAKQLFMNLTQNDVEAVKANLLYLGLFQVLITYLSSLFLDRFGRKPPMMLGHGVIVLSLLGVFVSTDIFNLPAGIVSVLVFCHILGFSISLGPISMIYASEILEDISPVIILIWIQTLVVALISDLMINSFGIGLTFLFYGIVSLLCFLYIQTEMIETKGLSRKEIQNLFQNKNRVQLESSSHIDEMQEIVSEDLSDELQEEKSQQKTGFC